ncbi:MAG: hypothetical protein K6E15_10060 [Prevotella sp.]|jgi:hypothetical protein|nr:hypothetical protein [Prevotella sp.]
MINGLKVLMPVLLCALLVVACGGQQQPKAYVSELTSDDSLTIRMGQWDLTRYHSDKLGMDINYPSFLYHQEMPSETSQELFVADDVSISVIVDSLTGMNYSAGQQMMGMGADLVDVGDDYSILAGMEEKWEYYSKVIDVDSTRVVTIMLRYYPEHGEAVEPIREWVSNFEVK